jgi:S-adenosylmethionine/arginine decarboxylase-like enzyme
VVDGIRYYGRHLILCGAGCNEAILSKQAITAFMPRLAHRIGMVPFGEPFVERFGGGIEVGISGVQLIETSAITMHTNDGARDLYLDVFSCKDFAAGDVLAAVLDTFAPANIQHEVFLRK